MNSPLVDAAPIITRSPEPYIAGRTEIRLLSGTHTGAAIGAIDHLIGPGFGPPPILHRHTREDAGWFVLDGEIEFAFADGTVVRADQATPSYILAVVGFAGPTRTSTGRLARSAGSPQPGSSSSSSTWQLEHATTSRAGELWRPSPRRS